MNALLKSLKILLAILFFYGVWMVETVTAEKRMWEQLDSNYSKKQSTK